MSKRRLNIILSSFLLFLLVVLALTTKTPTQVLSVSPNIVISEIQITGDSADQGNDEFVELYNPTEFAVVMESWKLTRRNSAGTEANLLTPLDGTIPAHGYFLIGHGTGYNGSVSLDEDYSAPSNALINNYTVLLYDGSDVLIDKVGFGTPAASPDPGFETAPFPSNPPANDSIERKPGANIPLAGNGTDTDNNANDFDLRTLAEPQNTASTPEPALASPSPSPSEGPTPSPEPSVSPTPTPEPSVSPTPEPSVSPSPTLEPSPSPTVEPTPSASPEVSPSPTPEASPSPTPEVSPSPTIEPSASPSPTSAASVSPTPEPSVSPSPTPTPSPQANIFFRGGLFTCGARNTQFFFFNRLISIPQYRCWLY